MIRTECFFFPALKRNNSLFPLPFQNDLCFFYSNRKLDRNKSAIMHFNSELNALNPTIITVFIGNLFCAMGQSVF